MQQDSSTQVSKASALSRDDQQKLLKIVLQDGVDCWKRIQETLGLKNTKEAIIEFLRIEDRTVLEAHKYLIEHAADISNEKVPSIVRKT